jgi:hypothetical protein
MNILTKTNIYYYAKNLNVSRIIKGIIFLYLAILSINSLNCVATETFSENVYIIDNQSSEELRIKYIILYSGLGEET